jgi:hypothetical protein
MDGWLTITTCPNCTSGNLAPYETVYTAPLLYVDFCGGVLPVLTVTSYVNCPGCGLVIQSPRMTDERIAEYYSSGTYRDTLGLSVEYMDRDELRRAREVAGFLRTHNTAPQSHLDIGSSRGYLLQEVGAPVQCGYDMNPSYAGDTPMRRGQLNYELVSSIHVLEHTAEPLEEIAWYASLTADLLLIEVPGENTKGGPLRFAHLYYFPPAMLAAMVEAAGMRIVAMETEPNTRILARKVDR